MFSKFQKASDKVLLFIRNTTNCAGFVSGSRLSMTSKSFPKVQLVYDICKKIFTPSDTVAPTDVGLREENQDDDRGHGFFGFDQLNRVARWAQPITYIDIYECDSFTMCIFCFPTSSVIPLHDHPGMTVFSKLLYGCLHVKAYDWVEPAVIREGKEQVRLAKLVADKVLTAPCGTSVLYPKSGGNLHCFTAVTPCAVLDILTPPYREDAGRRCTYYHDYPLTAFSTRSGVDVGDGKEEDYAWLAEIETPDDLYMRQGRYVGPAIEI
nr:plant cysteine oxidase 3 isoform X2 [Ziziphus jujuba var. spinosa]